MRPFKNQEETYRWCISEGNLLPLNEIDLEKIKATLNIAAEDLESAKDDLIKKRWNSAYKSYYDVLHELVEAFLCFDKIKSRNHQCLFTYLCTKHPELEFNWEFFEKVRTKRNGINYYGTPVNNKNWKEVELQFNLYLNKLRKEIENKL